MRWAPALALLPLLGIAACRHSALSPEDLSIDARFQAATDAARHQKFDEAAAKTGALLRASPADWRFRLLNIEILIGRRLAQQALDQLDRYGAPPPEHSGRALLLRGQALYTLGRFPEAETTLTQAAEAARTAHSAPLAAEVQLRRGTLLAMQSHFDEAQQMLHSVLDDSLRRHDTYLAANAASNLGFTLLSASRYDEAIPAYEQAQALFVDFGAQESVARAYGNLGACYARLGDYETASRYYDQAQTAFAKTGNRFEQQIWLGNGGNLHVLTGDYAAAVEPYKQALAIARAIPNDVWAGRWLSNLATTYIGLEDWQSAENYYKQAVDLKRRLNDTTYQANSVINAAEIAAGRGRPEEAVRLFREALTKPSEDPTVELDAHAGLARIEKTEAEFRAAIASIDHRGSALLKDEYRLSWLSSLIRFYRFYVDFLIANNQPDRALEIAESSRAHVLAAGNNSVTHVADYQRLARQSSATLLEYWLGDTHSYLWVVTPARTYLHQLPPARELRPLVERYRAVTAAGRNPLDVATDVGHKLYDTLLAPVLADAPQSTHFIVVPDGDLDSFNLETLPAGKSDRQFFIEQATISVAPSLGYLSTATPATPTRGSILLIGDPLSTNPQFPRLEFASQEMDSIANAMAGWESTVIKGADARPEAYSAAGPAHFGFIHFSAHATANEISPLDSAVILSGPAEKSRLSAREVMAQPLTARLVTVSACRSAGGKTYAGEGLVGFAWSFLRAGAGNVIAGLWDVNDRSTADLMTRLYTGIAAGQSIPESLRQAKLALLHKGGAYAKPFYWAPFELFAGRGSW
jgi:CHAT domain-containing protein/Flp pilus assembly protein TadD